MFNANETRTRITSDGGLNWNSRYEWCYPFDLNNYPNRMPLINRVGFIDLSDLNQEILIQNFICGSTNESIYYFSFDKQFWLLHNQHKPLLFDMGRNGTIVYSFKQFFYHGRFDSESYQVRQERNINESLNQILKNHSI